MTCNVSISCLAISSCLPIIMKGIPIKFEIKARHGQDMGYKVGFVCILKVGHFKKQ